MNQTKQIILFFFIISFIINSCKDKKSSIQKPNESAIEIQVDSKVKPFIEDSLIAGAVIGVAQNGKIKFLKSYGFSDLEKKTTLETNAIFPIASVTKTFTAIAIMQLGEKGFINLDDNINKFIDFDTKNKTITIRQLLNHTSGIKDYTESDIPSKLQEEGYSSDNLLRLLEEKKDDFEPGNSMDYNNSGYYLLALIIEKVTGSTYEEYLIGNIFQPLDMRNISNCYSASIYSKIVGGYNMNKNGYLNLAELGDFKMATGAGSICSTVEDLLKWEIAFHNSNRLLEKKSYEIMTTANKLVNGGFTHYGLGIEINQYNGNKVFSHNGVIEGYLSDTRYFPETDLTIVTLINTLGQIKPSKISNTIANYFIDKINLTKPFEGNLANLEGSYTGLVMGNKLKMDILVEDGKPFLESRGNKTQLQYIGQNTWLAEDGYTYEFMESKMQINSPKLSIIFNKSE
ncbi:MAG: beta-lactamase family protein [Cyclobacteriaceae bacterium]|nr:beta-lactamase family protein [Cyclobacteriaceae bacterium]